MRLSVTNLATLLFVLVATLTVHAQSTLYWTNTADGKVHRMTLPDGSSEEVLSGVLHQPRDIHVDLDGGKMYWLGFRTVRRANLDGSEIEDLAETDNPRVMALDAVSGWIYWTGDYAIQRMRLDGTARMVVVDSMYANGLAVNADEGILYWSTGGCWGVDGRVYQATVIGSNVKTFAAEQDCPRDLVLDPERQLLFWSVSRGVMEAQVDGSVIGLAVSTDVAHLQPEHKGKWIDHIALDVEQEHLYFSIQGTVYRNLGNREVAMLPLESGLGFSGFAVVGGDLYWTDEEQGAIQRLNLATDETHELIRSEVSDPRHLAIDEYGQKLYWTESHWIKRANLDGTNIEKLVGPNFFMDITDLALDPIGRKMYWSDWNGWGPHHDGGVYRSNMDGSNIDSLYFGGVFAIALDVDRGKMFIADAYLDDDFKIKEANLDGTYARDFVHSEADAMTFSSPNRTLYFHERDDRGWGTGHIVSAARNEFGYANLSRHFTTYVVTGLALDLADGKLYFTENNVSNESNKSRIRRSGLDGAGVEDVLTSSNADFGDIAIQSEKTAATSASTEVPDDFELSPAYPNPFNPSTTIRYKLASTQPVTIKVRDALGRQVALLVDEVQSAGPHSVQWVADVNTPSGTYFYTLETIDGAVTHSVTLLK